MQVFEMAPAGTRGLWLIAVILLVVLVPVTGLLVTTLVGARTARFEVSPEGVRLRGDLYGRLVRVEELVPGGARRVDLVREPDLRPVRRTMGTGLPGYQSGWFRLGDGSRALLYLTDRSRAVHVRTTAGYDLLLSPADPDGFLAALGAIGR